MRADLQADGHQLFPVAADFADLRSPRWGKALSAKELPSLANPEMRPTPVLLSIAFWGGLAFATFVIIALGYGLHFWH